MLSRNCCFFFKAAAVATITLLAAKYVYFEHILQPISVTLIPNNNQLIRKETKLPQTNPTAGYQRMYKEIACITERSNNTCSFPLLTDYHRRCGQFPALASWENISAGYPNASMSTSLCKLPPVTSAARRLRQYIMERNISSIAAFGDSQGGHYTKQLMATFSEASFSCRMVKREPNDYYVELDYFTKDVGFTSGARIRRPCYTCSSWLRVCHDTQQPASHDHHDHHDHRRHTIEVEYVFVRMSDIINLQSNSSNCQKTNQTDYVHPLCLENTTFPEYVFRHYLTQKRTYPQLLLLFSTFAHDQQTPLKIAYKGMESIYRLLTATVPASSSVIWYNAPGYHRPIHTAESPGFNTHQKIRTENRFLALLQKQHHRSGKSPAMYSFFDLYTMSERLGRDWDRKWDRTDNIHFEANWYQYVTGYTVAMLPSLPVSFRVDE